MKHLVKSPSSIFYKSYFKLGAAVVASNAICQVIDRLCTVVISGVSNASGIITGQTIGRGDWKKAMEQGETFYMLSIIFKAFSALMVFLFGPLTIKVYKLTS